MKQRIEKVAVLGSGVMGSAIAAHFANAGIPSLVLDIVPREPNAAEQARGLGLDDRRVRDRIARDSVKTMSKSKPSPLFSSERLSLIEVGNLEDDLERLREVDWIVEAVREDLEIKSKLFAKVAPHVADHAVLTSNTSGLPLHAMAEALPETLRSRFFGTHFFNPPRYMKLLEVIPTKDTSEEQLARISRFSTDRLGKGVVPAKDTPNFISNRIGAHSLIRTLHLLGEGGFTIEEVDAVTGPAMGRPKTATFRLADLVGLDTLLFVSATVPKVAPHDEEKDRFVVPDFFTKMVQKGLHGRKSGAGFYKKVSKPEKKIVTLDLDTIEYRDPVKPDMPELRDVKKIDVVEDRVRALVGGSGRAADLAWKVLAPTLAYSAMRLPEIADDVDTIDRALKLGFNWELGPFETWDALGFRATTERLRADGYGLPAWIDALYDSGADALYRKDGARLSTPTGVEGGWADVAVDPRATDFAALRAERQVRSNASATLVDLGDEVLGLEFHSKMNAIDMDTIQMIVAAADEAERNWQAIVVGNDGVSFCAGANLMMLVGAAMQQDWKAIEHIIRSFQGSLDRIERCAVPVVMAPHGMALGGGAEVVMAGNTIRAAAESYVGLVEVGAGLIPAGGGCMRLYKRNLDRLTDRVDLFPALKTTFETIGMAKVSTSAEEARALGFLRPSDGWSMNGDHRVAAAKDLALAMARSGYTPPLAERQLPVMGRAGVAVIESALVNMHEGRYISGHDRKIGGEIARIISGGDVAGPTVVSEQHVLDLEVESFLRLCGEPKTHQRIESLLKTGKPVRN